MKKQATRNPLRAWFQQFPKPMLQMDFAALAGISQSFLTALLSDTPPWPSRQTMRKIHELTNGEVTADMWMALDDPPSRHGLDIFGNPAWTTRRWMRFLDAARANLRKSIARDEALEK